MNNQNEKLKNLKNERLSILKQKIKTSTNFFSPTESSIQYEFEDQKDSKMPKNIAKIRDLADQKINKPLKKHGFQFYILIVTIVAILVLVGVILNTYAGRYSVLAKTFDECQKSISFLKSEEIEPELESCPDFKKPIWTLDYWQNGLKASVFIDEYNQTIQKNETKYNNLQLKWLDLSKDLENEFNLFAKSKTTELKLDQVLPSSNLKLGSKITNTLTQLSFYQEKNSELSVEINNLENDFQNKLTVYSTTFELSKYKVFFDTFQTKSNEEKIVSLSELKQTSQELTLFIDAGLKKLESESKGVAQELLKREFLEFSPEEFYQIYNNNTYKFVSDVQSEISITGDKSADLYIESLAVNRGYQKRNIANENRLEKIDGELLQPEAREAFERLRLAGRKDGINLILVSGYRSVVEQKNLFNSRFVPYFSPEQIINKEADSVLDKLLSTSSVPGYSRHHTGYTFDLGCSDRNLLGFKNTKCYEWISANNYLNAKRFGLIPSYPEGVVSKQGPDPEAWEYVWVGVEKLKNYNNQKPQSSNQLVG